MRFRTIALCIGVSLSWPALAEGISCDGVTDATPHIAAAIGAVSAEGGVVHLPPGRCLVQQREGAVHPTIPLLVPSNVTIKGAGRYATTLVVAPGSNIQALVLEGENIEVSDLGIDGNGETQTAGVHGIRTIGVENATITRFYIRNVHSYGIGMQKGDTIGLVIHDGLIEDAGSDCIDFKNPNSRNRDNRISQVTVRRCGRDLSSTGKAAIDVRSAVLLSDIIVDDPSEVGIRFRFGESDTPGGYGGHNSILSNFRVICRHTATRGVDIEALNVTATSGYVEGCGIGVDANQHEAKLNSILAIGGVVGFHFRDQGFTTGPWRSHGTGLTARSNSDAGFKIEADNVRLLDFLARANGKGVEIIGADRTFLIGGESTGNANNFVDQGTRTIISGFFH